MEYMYADGSKLIEVRDEENHKTIYTLLAPNGDVISKIESFDEELAIINEIDAEIPMHVQERRKSVWEF